MNSPEELNHAVSVDALCHGIEAYLSRDSRDDYMTNMISEAAFKQLGLFKDRLLTNTITEDDYTRQALHIMLQGIVIINEVTGVPHGLGYPLSHHYHVPHGLACGVFEGEYLREFNDPDSKARVDKVVKLAGFENIDEFCAYIQDVIAPHIHIQVTLKELSRIFLS